MKKILWLLAGLLILFLGLVYISVSGTNKEFETATIKDFEEIAKMDFTKIDSVTVAASSLYTGNSLKETMQGENYREAWATPVTLPVVFLDTLFGGMKLKKEGGGSQTHSLKLESPTGILYSLRSINKDPQSHVPELARTLGLENIVIDGISAQHPYGAVAAAALADIAGVLHTNPQPVFVPRHAFLGDLNDKYGNRIYLLEYETESRTNWTSYENVAEIVETDDLQELKQKMGEDLILDKGALVRARLFDLLIGDWDRHAKQWGWVLQRSGKDLIAIPLPGDRDNAFFKLEGVIPSIISNKNVEPLVRPFEKEIDHLPGLVYPFDVYFLRNTPEDIFIREAEHLQKALTDESINKALRTWPKAIYDLDGEEIANKIKHRKDNLVEYAIAFRKIIEERDLLTEPLKGSEDVELDEALIKCFDCDSSMYNSF